MRKLCLLDHKMELLECGNFDRKYLINNNKLKTYKFTTCNYFHITVHLLFSKSNYSFYYLDHFRVHRDEEMILNWYFYD
jgi:hypothetical protein